VKVPGIDTPHSLLWREDKKRWVLKVKDPVTGRWPQTVAGPEVVSERAALAWARAKLLAPPAPAAPSPEGTGKTLKEAFELWCGLLKARPKLRPTTVVARIGVTRRYVVPAFGARRLDTLTPADVRQWVRDLRSKVAPLTLRNALVALRQLLDEAHAEGWASIPINPARDRRLHDELPRFERQSGKVIVQMPIEHAQALLDDPKMAWFWLIRYLVAFGLGLRDGEIAALCWHHVHLDAPVPHVEVLGSVSSMTRKLGPTKTESSERQVPMPPAVLQGLDWWRRVGFEMFYGRRPTPDSPVLPHLETGGYCRPHSSERLQRDLKRLGLPMTVDGFPLDFHSMRRGCASALDRAGVDEGTIGELLGHRSQSITRRAYAEAALERLWAAISKLPLVWRPASVVPVVPGAPEGGTFRPSGTSPGGGEEGGLCSGLGGAPPLRHQVVDDGEPSRGEGDGHEVAEKPGFGEGAWCRRHHGWHHEGPANDCDEPLGELAHRLPGYLADCKGRAALCTPQTPSCGCGSLSHSPETTPRPRKLARPPTSPARRSASRASCCSPRATRGCSLAPPRRLRHRPLLGLNRRSAPLPPPRRAGCASTSAAAPSAVAAAPTCQRASASGGARARAAAASAAERGLLHDGRTRMRGAPAARWDGRGGLALRRGQRGGAAGGRHGHPRAGA
jgi:integrase